VTPEQRLALFCQVLGDTNRLRILRFLAGERRSVSEIVTAMGVSQPLASHHLRAMREQGILETKREGPFIFYTLCDPRLTEALSFLADVAQDAKIRQEEDAMDTTRSLPFPCMGRMRKRRST
jgi:DNA-binding transcriptional ArsR family regulator